MLTVRDRPVLSELRLSAQELGSLWQPILSDYRRIDAADHDTTVLMQGRVGLWQIRSGFYLYTADWVPLRDMHCQCLLRSGVHVLLRLQGSTRITLGDMQLFSDSRAGTAPAGIVFSLDRSTPFALETIGETCERMVGLLLTPARLAHYGLRQPDTAAGAAHSFRTWQPSARASTLANQLLRPGAQANPLQRMLCESKALELVAEALDFLAHDQPEGTGLRPDEFRRASRLKAFLDSGEADRLNLAAIAQYAGCNANSLQQWFRQAYGKTIFDYLRESRLRRAARLLEQDGISVAQAAEIAGYGSQSNFSTAFRRCFGICPKQLRSKA